MGYAEDIRQKLDQMHDKKCHEEFRRLTDALLASRQYDVLPVLLNMINKYDSLSRQCFGYKTTIEHAKERSETFRRGTR